MVADALCWEHRGLKFCAHGVSAIRWWQCWPARVELVPATAQVAVCFIVFLLTLKLLCPMACAGTVFSDAAGPQGRVCCDTPGQSRLLSDLCSVADRLLLQAAKSRHLPIFYDACVLFLATATVLSYGMTFVPH